MARPLKPQTPLAERLIEVRDELGFMDDRKGFAERLGLVPDTLGSYERGKAAPAPDVLARYHEEFGVNISWLVTGLGEHFDDPSKAPAPSTKVDAWAMGRAYSVIEKVCKDIGRPVTGSQLAEEAAELYGALLGRVVDVRERPMVETALALLAEEAKERMIGRKPGSGKRSASSW